MTSLSVILAFRDSTPEQERQRVWDWVRPLYARHLPEAELVIGTDDGEDPFHKTVAFNRAVAQASGEILLLGDTDTWCPSTQVLAGLKLMQEFPTAWVRPWNIKLKLGQADTERLTGREAGSWNGEIPIGADLPRRRENLNTYWAAPPLLFRREQFELVGGFDERFRGWGQEDEAFCLAMRAMVGRPKVVLGTTIHLWHPRIGKSGKDLWIGETDPRANEKLVMAYKKLVRYPDQMAQYVRTR